MTPNAAYRRLNKLLWLKRLPPATITLVDDSVMPLCLGLTLQDVDFVTPVIFLNMSQKHWGKTLVHECVHIAEPQLPHGKVFNSLVESYWRFARKNIKGLDRL